MKFLLLLSIIALALCTFPVDAFKSKLLFLKISKELKPNPITYDFFVIMRETVDTQALKQEAKKMSWAAQGQHVVDTLQSKAEMIQKPLKLALEKAGLTYKSYWISNAVFVSGASQKDLAMIASRADVKEITPNTQAYVDPKIEEDNAKAIREIQDNIEFVNAPKAWAAGFTGKGVTICVVDTGVQWDHIALKNNYRGVDSSGSVNHNYNWFDAVKTGSGSSCGYDLKVPCDDNGHGTHCTGTACGYGQGIGVAKEAKFTHCRSMSRGSGTLQQILDCLEWLVNPTDVNGQNPDTSKRAQVSSHSYGFSGSAGAAFAQAVTAVNAAGVAFVAAAGNSGNRCGSMRGDPAKLDDSFSIGALATVPSQNLASFSSVGPTPTGTIKPNVVAPGSNIYSSTPGNTFRRFSGTSMACPTVAGQFALYWTEGKGMDRDVEKAYKVTQDKAISKDQTVCSSSGTPNNFYGWGRIDAALLVDA